MRWPPVDISLEIAYGFIAAVSDQHNIMEPCLVKVKQDGIQCPGIRDIAGKGAVIHGHMAAESVYDNLQGLLQREMLLVLALVDISQFVSIC